MGLLANVEWDIFYNKLKEPLDISFRINSIDKYKERTLQRLQQKIDVIKKDPDMAGKAPEKVKWYPN